MITARAIYPFEAPGGTGVAISTAADASARDPGTTYTLDPDVSVCAPVDAIVTASADGSVVLNPMLPLDLTGGLEGWESIGIDAIVFAGLDLGEVADVVTVQADGTPRPVLGATASAGDWQAGDQALFLKAGEAIWPPAGVSSPATVTLTVEVDRAAAAISLDGQALIDAIEADGGWVTGGEPPAGLTGSPASPLEAVGPTPANADAIDQLEADATSLVIYGPPTSETAPIPADVAFIGAGSAAVTASLQSGSTADWSADITETPGDQLATASGAEDFTVPAVDFSSLPSELQQAQELTCRITATFADGSTATLDLPVLQHPPVFDSGKASRAGVPLEGAPRASLAISDLPSSSGIQAFGSDTTVTVGGTDAEEVSASPDGTRVFFAVPAGSEGDADLVVSTGGGSATVSPGITYTADANAGLDGLKTSLGVAAEEATAVAADGGGADQLQMFCDTLRPNIVEFQAILAAVGQRLTNQDELDAWGAMVLTQSGLIVDAVNSAVASLGSPPIASCDGQPMAGSDDEPTYDLNAYTLAMTPFDQVVVSSSISLGG